ncbi:MAG: proline dehydrogenase family protein [Pirellulales bacterium]|nr:proline dehydrogenase family protein [Pirellulales bacterium]
MEKSERSSSSDQVTAVQNRQALEARTQEIGRSLLTAAREYKAGWFSARFWNDQMMNFTMKDPAFKVQLFRFVDAFPMLRSSGAVYDCLTDYLTQPGVKLPPGLDLGLKAGRIAKGIVAKTISNRITALAGNFIAGTDAAGTLPTLRSLWKEGSAFSVDLVGEACLSEREADEYQRRYLDLLEKLPGEVAQWPANPRLETDHLGPIPRANVSIKITSLDARPDPISFDATIDRLFERLRPILELAARKNVLINFDLEQFAVKDLSLSLFERCASAVDFPAGLAIQSYLRSGEQDAQRVIDWAKRAGRQVTVRLIKGAYWDYEVTHAEQMGWPVPVWTDKRQTDACFERMAEMLVGAAPRSPGEGGVKLALGSHNVRSIAHTLSLLRKYDLPDAALEIQMLWGMADSLKVAVHGRELRLREYVPIGQMIPGMAYLVRRLLENTSNQSWLRAGFFEGASEEQLLASPHDAPAADDQSPAQVVARLAQRHRLSPAVAGLDDGLAFFNESLRDFSQARDREAFARAVASASVPKVESSGTAESAAAAVGRAAAALPAWRDRDARERSALLIEAARRMHERRDELSAVMIREGGKTWREADADVCEAIDFARYYAREAVGLFEPKRLGRFVGELDEVWYQPRGVAAVISPWNFPLAICAGMTLAALATGNPTVVKPSTQTPGIAKMLCDILWESGVPADVLQFLPGPGRVIGNTLVRDPRVALIAFTGSKEVGLDILRAAGETPEGQALVKKVVCEMGGKNAIIVDESADLDEAVAGVRQSAFGYSGQKCSACSRAIVLDAVYDVFLARLVESTRALIVGDPAEPTTDVGPVIDPSAAAKIREYIKIGKSEGRLEVALDVPAGLEEKIGKPVIGPTIFSGIRPEHRLAQEEIFGPVLSVMRVGTFDEALAVANGSVYKLTGGVFSRRPAHLAAARRDFRVGNLYINRGITGALVGRQPFGGFGLSGGGTKAGGVDYLLHFVEPRSCTENTLRHGFAPDLV